MRLSPTNWCKNIVPRSSDGSCVPKECDDFGEMCMICEACVAAADWPRIKNETIAKYNAERRAISAVDEAFLQKDLQKYEWALHY